MRRAHSTGNVFWCVSHGDKVSDVEVSGLNGEAEWPKAYSVLLADGPVSDLRMVEEGYDFSGLRFTHFSCCLLGRLETQGRTHEMECMVASLTVLGCRRLSSALWELCDLASARFSFCLAKALRKHSFVVKPHAHSFAIAYRQAICEFRTIDDGRWDHEYYWAPYILYGLP